MVQMWFLRIHLQRHSRSQKIALEGAVKMLDYSALQLMAETAAEAAPTTEEVVNATMFNVGDGNGIWYLIGAALVFFMQCGFAMV